MGLISEKIKEFLDLQKLGYVATVSDNGHPNLSPKGTIIGWDSKTIAFANIRSPDTVQNLQKNPHVEISVIDPLLRKGFLFKGTSRIINTGETYDEIMAYYRENGIKSPIHSIVLVDVANVEYVTSPLYDLGATEGEVKSKWKNHFQNL